MNGCRPRWYGPSQPSARSRRMSSARLIGFGTRQLPAVQINPVEDGQRVAELQAEQQPLLQGALQLHPAIFERGGFGPTALAFGNRAVNAPIVHQLIMS